MKNMEKFNNQSRLESARKENIRLGGNDDGILKSEDYDYLVQKLNEADADALDEKRRAERNAQTGDFLENKKEENEEADKYQDEEF